MTEMSRLKYISEHFSDFSQLRFFRTESSLEIFQPLSPGSTAYTEESSDWPSCHLKTFCVQEDCSRRSQTPPTFWLTHRRILCLYIYFQSLTLIFTTSKLSARYLSNGKIHHGIIHCLVFSGMTERVQKNIFHQVFFFSLCKQCSSEAALLTRQCPCILNANMQPLFD